MCGGPLVAPATVDVRFWPKAAGQNGDFLAG